MQTSGLRDALCLRAGTVGWGTHNGANAEFEDGETLSGGKAAGLVPGLERREAPASMHGAAPRGSAAASREFLARNGLEEASRSPPGAAPYAGKGCGCLPEVFGARPPCGCGGTCMPTPARRCRIPHQVPHSAFPPAPRSVRVCKEWRVPREWLAQRG